MADPPPYPDPDKDTGVRPGRESTPLHAGSSREQEPARAGSLASKVVIAIVAALVVVIVILHLTGVVGPGTH